MGIGRRLYDLLRANVGYHLRSGSGDEAARRYAPWPGEAPRDERPPPPPGAEDPFEQAPPPRAEPPSEYARAYAALELPYGAGPEAIRKAHKRLLRRYHPDRFARDEDRLADATRLSQELTRARDALLEAIAEGRLRAAD